MTIFDRSWYGRVLVERVEKLCAEDDWMRAYEEINDFEEQLIEANCVVTKFWLTISKQELTQTVSRARETPLEKPSRSRVTTGATVRNGMTTNGLLAT